MPRLRLVTFTLPLLVVGATPAWGQVQPFDSERLVRGVDSMSIAMIRGADTIPVGELWDEVANVIRADGISELRRVYRTNNRIFGPHLDTAFADPKTLYPIRRRTYSRIASDSLVWRGDSLTGWVASSADSIVTIARLLPRGTMDPGSFDLVVRSSNLGKGVLISVPTYLAATDSLVTLKARVEGPEEVKQRDGSSVQTWKVLGDFNGMRVEMWVSQDNRALVKERIWLAPEVSMYMLR